jgi:uncharacterized 2Fe-2S/4Fe-4S cluster protein (DUF4445 family)
MPNVTVIYGEDITETQVAHGSLLGDAIIASGLPLEQPCAGRGTCGKCKVLVQGGVTPCDEIEIEHLTPGERAINYRLACRARVHGDVQVTLAPIVVYSNKTFRASNRYKRDTQVPLGLAIDLGSTTVAAFLTMLDNGEVCAGAATLNQQTVFGGDVISRLAAVLRSAENGERLHNLALASINQAVDSLKLAPKIYQRIERVVIVGNVAMHHLLAALPVGTLAVMPFQPYDKSAIHDARALMGGIFPDRVRVSLPPLIGGFVGTDTLACLAYFGFDNPPGPMAAIDLGTNGEVMVTDGRRILTASTAAGPAFEGVNISCGTRAVDGAIVGVRVEAGDLVYDTIGGAPPIGLTGSGLLSMVWVLRRAGVLREDGRFADDPPVLAHRITNNSNALAQTATVTPPQGGTGTSPHASRGGEYRGRRIALTSDGQLSFTQKDVRELQKAKGAMRAAMEILMAQLGLQASDLQRIVLTGSFGAQLDIEAVLGVGLLPPVSQTAVEAIPNGAGLGAAMFLSDEGFAWGERLAARTEQVNLDQDADFMQHYIAAMALDPGQ